MKLWILKSKDPPEGKEDPWVPWYNKAFGFVIRAKTEKQARKLANDNGGSETGEISHVIYRTGGDPWLDPEFSSCEELQSKGKSEVIMKNYKSA